MNRMRKLLAVFAVMCAVFVYSSGKVEAKVITGTSGSPATFRALCTSGVPVDFAAYPSNVQFDGVNLTYNINIRWQRCSGTETRAYAIYGDAEVCPPSGIYGTGGWATDCVKYVGSPPYSGPGNGLACWGGINEQCVTTDFPGARRAENQPAHAVNSITIPMSATNNLWHLSPNAPGTWTVSNQMCQYYKTGSSFTSHNYNRCITLSMSVSWVATVTPPTIACGSVNTSPTSIEPGSPFNLTAGFSTSGGSSGQPNTLYSVRVYLLAAGHNGTYAAAFASIPWGGTNNRTAALNNLAVPSGGVITGHYIVRVNGAANPGEQISCPISITIANKPYFKVYGGDVQAGAAGGFTTTCGKNNAARIMSWHRQPSPGTGAGTQLAAYALGAIDGFASGQQRNATNPRNLTFANAAAPYGGSWGPGNMPCAADFLASAPAPAPSGVVGPRTLGSTQQTIRVNGDARITGDILYHSGASTNLSDLPSFRLIATGNIYVGHNVQELNGLFVAGGTFYTCSSGWSPPNEAQLRTGYCNNPLTVYGAVIANNIKLNRTRGTLGEATTAEQWSNGVGNPAEKFIYSPLVWLTSDFSQGGDADSYRTLPPTL